MYVSNLVDFVLQKVYYEDHNVSFFKHYNTFSIPLKILYHEFQPGVIKGAYSPMMDWVVALYDRYYSTEQTFETFLDNAGVYSLHKNIYVTYREKGFCERTEDIENEYEHDKFLKGLIGIFNYISEKVPLLIVLNKVHLASISSYEFIYKEITENPNKKMAFICTINEVFVVPDYVKSVKNDIMVVLEGKNMIQDWGLDDKENALDEQDVFVPVAESFDSYLVLINNMIETGATTQAIYYCDIIKEAIDGGTLTADEESIHRFYRLYADVYGSYSNMPAMYARYTYDK